MNYLVIISAILFGFSFLMMHIYVLNNTTHHKWSHFELFRVTIEYVSLTKDKKGHIGIYFYINILSFLSFFINISLQMPSIRTILHNIFY